MRIFLVLLIIYLSFLLMGCENVPNKQNGNPINNNNSFNNFFKLETKIYLKGDDFVGAINEVIVFNNKIFIGDFDKTRKIIVYKINGEQIAVLGRQGQGPGQYQSLNLFFPLNDEIFLFDPIRLKFLEFDKNLTFKNEYSFHSKLNFFDPNWFSHFSNNDIALYSPRIDDTGFCVYVFNKSLSFKKAFCKDEKLFSQINFGGLKNVCVDKNDNVWVAGFFVPTITIFNRDGEKLFKIQDFSNRKDFINLNTSKITFKDFLKQYFSKKGYINGIFSTEKFIVVYYSIPFRVQNLIARKSYFALYKLDGTLYAKDIELPAKFVFVNVWKNKFIFCDIYSKNVEENNANAILYIYTLKNSEKR